MGPALHGEWVGCHAGLVKHRGARGSAPGWVDFAREATCIPSRARVRRTSAAAPAAAQPCRRRGQWASPPSAQQAQEHAVLRYDARQMHDMLVVGAERLQSAAQAKLQVNAYRDRLRRMKREANAATLVQAVWRAGRARVAVDEMRWGATIVQANFRARRSVCLSLSVPFCLSVSEPLHHAGTARCLRRLVGLLSTFRSTHADVYAECIIKKSGRLQLSCRRCLVGGGHDAT